MSKRNNPKDIWKYINKKSDKECWEWNRNKDKDGYGQISINNFTKKYIVWFMKKYTDLFQINYWFVILVTIHHVVILLIYF